MPRGSKTFQTNDSQLGKPKRAESKKAPAASSPKKARQPRPKNPSLENFLSKMPFDIILHTFNHLTSPDLLNLSWTSKSLRSLLLDRSAASSTWQHARRNCRPPPPPLPSDMSEPEYANLLFDMHCHVCEKPKSKEVIWTARIRCCKECLADCFESEGPLRQHLQLYCDLLPAMMDEFVISKIVPGCTLVDRQDGEQYYYSREISEWYLDEYKSVLAGPKSQEAKAQWMSAKEEDLKERKRHASLCEEWVVLRSDTRAIELAEKRTQRGEQILEKLATEGWANDVRRLSEGAKRSFMLLPDVHQPRDLTDTQWEKIRGVMFSFMQDIRDAQRKADRAEIIGRRCKVMQQAVREASLPIPREADFAEIDPFRGLIFDTPLAEEVSKEAFVSTLTEVSATWNHQATKELLDILKTSMNPGSPAFSTADLDLVSIGVFGCREWCWDSFAYPDVLDHHCNIMKRVITHDDTEILDEYLECRPWSSWNFGYDPDLHRIRGEVLAVCGYDKNSTKWRDLDLGGEPGLRWVGCVGSVSFCLLSLKEALLPSQKTAEALREVASGRWFSFDEESWPDHPDLRSISKLLCRPCKLMSECSLQTALQHCADRHASAPNQFVNFRIERRAE